MRIIGIDPGETTGIVVARPYEGEIVITEAMHLAGMASAHWLDDTLSSGSRIMTQVVIEQFTISQRTLQGTRHGPMETLYTIGALRYVCHKHGLTTPFFQTPAQAKSAYSDAVLKDLGLWPRVSGPHERDALRHVLLHARTRNLWRGLSSVPHLSDEVEVP